MIEGIVPLVALWALVILLAASLALILLTPWRSSQLGKHLLVYTAILLVWYTELLVASIFGYPIWMQALQALTFLLMPLVVGWRVALQAWFQVNKQRARK